MIKLTDIEFEIVFLQASNESIGSMVNYELLRLSEGNDGAQAIFKTSIHQRLFNILLVDFLSPCSGQNISSLDALMRICESPHFNQDHSIKPLRTAVRKFKKWLEREIRVKKLWFPSIQLETTLNFQREELIKICGDISKHNFSRLDRRAKAIQNIFKRNGREVTEGDGYVLLDEIYQHGHVNIFSYQGSLLVEMLNDIKWGVQEYLQPEFKRSTYGCIPPRYRYDLPSGINAEFVKHFYERLMSDISSSPCIKKFKTYKILTKRF